MISGVTSATLGLTTMPQLVAALHERGRAVAREYLDAVSPFSVFIYVPVAAAYACFAHPLLEALLGGSLTAGTIELLWDASRIFLLMALAWALLAPLTTLAFSLELFSGLAIVSAATVATQVVLVLATRSRGAEAVAVAHAVSGTVLVALVLVLVFRREAPAAAARAVALSLPAPALALVFPAVAALGLDGSVPAAIAGALIAGALYAGLSLILWPAVARRALALLRR
jgi:O-antigen/teichoic acid export membrane protein